MNTHKTNKELNKKESKFKLSSLTSKGLLIVKLFISILLTVIYFCILLIIDYNVLIDDFGIFVYSSTLLVFIFSYKLVNSLIKLKDKEIKKTSKNKDLSFIELLPTNEPTFTEYFEELEEDEEYEDEDEFDESVDLEVEEQEGYTIRNNTNINYEELNQEELSLYNTNLKQFLDSNGLITSSNNIRVFLSSLFSSKLLIFNNFNVDKNLKLEFLDLFSTYTGSVYMNEVMYSDNHSVEMLLESNNTNLSLIIESANSNKNLIHIISFEDVSLENVSKTFKSIIEYSLTSYSNKKFNIPSNLWFVLIPKKEELTKQNKDIKLGSFNLNFSIEKKVLEETILDESNKYRLTNTIVKEVIRDLSEDYYLKESLWKKLDEVNNYLIKHNISIFDNRVIRQMEKFSTVYKLTDGDSLSLIDDLLSSKILPLLNSQHISKKNEEDETFLELCDRLFGLEELKQTQIYVTKMTQSKEL